MMSKSAFSESVFNSHIDDKYIIIRGKETKNKKFIVIKYPIVVSHDAPICKNGKNYLQCFENIIKTYDKLNGIICNCYHENEWIDRTMQYIIDKMDVCIFRFNDTFTKISDSYFKSSMLLPAFNNLNITSNKLHRSILEYEHLSSQMKVTSKLHNYPLYFSMDRSKKHISIDETGFKQAKTDFQYIKNDILYNIISKYDIGDPTDRTQYEQKYDDDTNASKRSYSDTYKTMDNDGSPLSKCSNRKTYHSSDAHLKINNLSSSVVDKQETINKTSVSETNHNENNKNISSSSCNGSSLYDCYIVDNHDMSKSSKSSISSSVVNFNEHSNEHSNKDRKVSEKKKDDMTHHVKHIKKKPHVRFSLINEIRYIYNE